MFREVSSKKGRQNRGCLRNWRAMPTSQPRYSCTGVHSTVASHSANCGQLAKIQHLTQLGEIAARLRDFADGWLSANSVNVTAVSTQSPRRVLRRSVARRLHVTGRSTPRAIGRRAGPATKAVLSACRCDLPHAANTARSVALLMGHQRTSVADGESWMPICHGAPSPTLRRPAQLPTVWHCPAPFWNKAALHETPPCVGGGSIVDSAMHWR